MGEGDRIVDNDDKIVTEAGIEGADLTAVIVDQQPVPLLAALVHEIKADDRATLRQELTSQGVADRPEDDGRIRMVFSDVDPLFSPLRDGTDDVIQLPPCLGGLVERSSTTILGPDRDHARTLQLLQPGAQQRPRQPGTPEGDVVEGHCAVEDVSDDDQCPTLAEDLGPSGHRTELPVRAHASIVRGRTPRSPVLILDFRSSGSLRLRVVIPAATRSHWSVFINHQ